MSSIGINYSSEFGFTKDHWETIRTWAIDNQRHLVIFRGGKEASIPWIEKGFPAKPLSQKAKVDPELGLLIARGPEEREAAFRAGFYILQEEPTGKVVAAHPQQRPVKLDERFGDTWHVAGAVIDPSVGLPLTSDYDMAAVIDCVCPDYFLTYGSLSDQTSRGSTNLWVEAVAEQLNQLFVIPRIMHGSQAQYTGDLINLSWNQAEFDAAVAEGKTETLLAFYPSGKVESMSASAGNSYHVLQDIMVQFHPEMSHAFRQ